ncbi:elongation of very long chain fatty acids protein F-like [Drosophila novamexicana]|uniref:elongation of very long chain fatty acids protein F-like n=1 Tax=Drosophila novamexicana TaxID=47314 RepID=UPI0011E5EFF8|nr:elongation of very long chain fatty acids protein F-like [Drosophila novamexicana]
MFEIFNRPPADPVQLPLTFSPWPVTLIVTGYLLFVLKLGRLFMANRAPYDLRGVLKVYNLIQIVYNGSLFLLATFAFVVIRPYDIKCIMVLPQDNPFKTVEHVLTYAYFLNKILDLLDTVFIVLRKNYRQVSVLHVVHHAAMVLAVYSGLRFYGYGGHFVLTGYLNVFVHCVMYIYYYISSQSQAVKQSPWWKQYITIIQMLQFLIVIAHSIWTLKQTSCNLSPYPVALVLFMGTLMFILFSNFYVHNYILPKKNKLD